MCACAVCLYSVPSVLTVCSMATRNRRERGRGQNKIIEGDNMGGTKRLRVTTRHETFEFIAIGYQVRICNNFERLKMR